MSVMVGWTFHQETTSRADHFFVFWEFPVSWHPRDYEFLDLVWKKWHDKIRLGEFVKRQIQTVCWQITDIFSFLEISRKENISVPTSFSHAPIMNRNQPQNSFCLIVVQTPSFPSEPILLHSAGPINNSNQTPLLIHASWVGLYTYMNTYIYIYMNMHTHILIHIDMYICIYIYVYTYIYIKTYI